MASLGSPRLGTTVQIQAYENSANLGPLNSYSEESVSHQILSRRNVESLTFLEEEDCHPSYERNENDAFLTSAGLTSNSLAEMLNS